MRARKIRKCYLCGSTKTRTDKKGVEYWSRFEKKGDHLCSRCYSTIYHEKNGEVTNAQRNERYNTDTIFRENCQQISRDNRKKKGKQYDDARRQRQLVDPLYNEKRLELSRKAWEKFYSIPKNAEMYKDKRNDQALIDRYAVLTHYSVADYPLCECCSESEFIFLTIEHPEERSKEEKGKYGRELISFLKEKNLPEGRKVFCWNCNCSSGFRGGTCAHKKHFEFPNTSDGRIWAKIFEGYKEGDETKCTCCGENELGFLTLGHTSMTREKEKEMFGETFKGKNHVLRRKLVQRGFPPGFAIECFNCNSGKEANGGTCPHESSK